MSKIQINFDDLEDFAVQLGKAANKYDEALGHINVDLYSLLANIPGVASKNIQELENIFESNLKRYKKNLVKAQHLMRITEAIMSENERKLARKAREIVQENSWDFTPLQMVEKNVLVPEIYGRVEQDSLTKLTDEQVEGLRNYIGRIKDGEIESNPDDYRAMPEDYAWQGNIFPSNPGRKPEVDHVTKALGKFAFDFLVGDVVTILDPEALTEDKLIAAAMMLPPAKVVKLVDKLKDLEKMKDTIDHLDDVSDKVKDTSGKLQDASNGVANSVKLSSGNIQHIKKHTLAGMKEQAKYLNDVKLANKLDGNTFFNPKWSQEQIINNTEKAYNALRVQGKTGLQSFTIDGEDIFVFIKSDGMFDTAYGTHVLTVKDFR